MKVLENETMIDSFLICYLGRVVQGFFKNRFEFSTYKSRAYVTNLRIVIEPQQIESEIERAIKKALLNLTLSAAGCNSPYKKNLVNQELLNPNGNDDIIIPVEYIDKENTYISGNVIVLSYSGNILPISLHSPLHAIRFLEAISI